jgi:uncharacterized protein YjiS (DUF1127 family)
MNYSFERYRRLRHYRDVRRRLETLSDHELLDAGVKRYQLGAVARRRALKPRQP